MQDVLPERTVWFLTGSQHLYGDATLRQVADDARGIVDGLAGDLPIRLIAKPTLTTAEEITRCCREAEADEHCVGVIAWMHTFSPAKMWIAGLMSLGKPLLHLHTQFHREIPWQSIDMDFMNLHQSAHGDREFGHIVSRMRRDRTVVVGHWQDAAVRERIDTWMRAAAAWQACRTLKIARFGDNMRSVAVTEGDKVGAQIRFGWTVDGYGVGDLADAMAAVDADAVDALCAQYDAAYDVVAALAPGGERREALRDQARIELGLRAFLEAGGYDAVTDTFEDLHGLPQLPGLAIQRLMADGYGFGAEGDWKTAALLRCCKLMGTGLPGGASFMEDYTYHLPAGGETVLGAHMLEVCPSIAEEQPRLEIHPLGIGGKDDPPRLVFGARAVPAINASLIDLGDRFRLVCNELDGVADPATMPHLPVARAFWQPRPDFHTAAAAWILAGAAHHSVYTQALRMTHFEDFARMADIELVRIDAHTSEGALRDALRWNDCAFAFARRG